MFLIRATDETYLGCNPPGDDILAGLLAQYGPAIRVVRAATPADHQAMQDLRNAVAEEGGAPASAGNTLALAGDGLTIEVHDKAGAVIGSWPGVLVYPLPAPPPPEPIDMVALNKRALALGFNLDELALKMGMQQGQPITQDAAELLAKEVAFQEATAGLPRVGQFTPSSSVVLASPPPGTTGAAVTGPDAP